MPREKAKALKKILGNLELDEVVKECSDADIFGVETAQHSTEATVQDRGHSDSQPQLSPHVSATAIADISEQNQTGAEGGFGSNLTIWNSHDTLATRNLPDSTHMLRSLGSSPFDDDLDTTLLDDVSDQPLSADCASTDLLDAGASDWGGSNESLIDELSHCVSSLKIGPTGRTKLCGPSSVFTVDSVSIQDLSPQHKSAFCPISQPESSLRLPNELEEHLVDLYLTWENPSSDVIDPEMYHSARAKQRERAEDTAYFSEALRDAIALGFQLGRPVRISLEDVTVAKPGSSYHQSYTGGQDESSPTGDMPGQQLSDFVRQQRVILSDIMAPCGYIL
ncbi:hypothetical protein B9Z65_2010 [Elsinoe australis]|uniref:Uncharacterized protein n=1 Tax=Elsinoe australis TaxID=40998 RepID=A0A2P7YMS2_9PEZI|nr:hypothetical protein B9Z65_2010 [Elsinoe australis]